MLLSPEVAPLNHTFGYPAIVPMGQQRQISVATVTQQTNKLIIPIE